MNDTQIDQLITARSRITDRRDELIDYVALDALDSLLREVPAGQRNDVDLLLGRMCAQLPERPGYIVNPAAQMWGWMGDDTITTGQIAELEARTAETANETEDSR